MFCTLYAGALACNSLLHTLLYQYKNKKFESLRYSKKTFKLSYVILIVCIVDALTTYNLKAVILAIVI